VDIYRVSRDRGLPLWVTRGLSGGIGPGESVGGYWLLALDACVALESVCAVDQLIAGTGTPLIDSMVALSAAATTRVRVGLAERTGLRDTVRIRRRRRARRARWRAAPSPCEPGAAS
jgi:hypothetical protein